MTQCVGAYRPKFCSAPGFTSLIILMLTDPLINIFASSVALLLCISDARRLLLCIFDARTSSIQIGRSRTDLSSESTKRSMRLFFLDYFAENLI